MKRFVIILSLLMSSSQTHPIDKEFIFTIAAKIFVFCSQHPESLLGFSVFIGLINQHFANRGLMNKRFDVIENRLDGVQNSLDQLIENLAVLRSEFSGRFDVLLTRFDSVDTALETLETNFGIVRMDISDLDGKIVTKFDEQNRVISENTGILNELKTYLIESEVTSLLVLKNSIENNVIQIAELRQVIGVGVMSLTLSNNNRTSPERDEPVIISPDEKENKSVSGRLSAIFFGK